MPLPDTRATITGVERAGALAPRATTDSVLVGGGRVPAWTFDTASLQRLASMRAADYQSARPFPFVVLDDCLPFELLDEVAQQFPPVADEGWRRHDDHRQRKLQWGDATRLPSSIAQFIALLQSAPFIAFLEGVTGITGLVGDPHCFHGGPHVVESGGFLKIHCDQSLQERLHLYRRVNVIVYLNREWDPAWGGALELWNSEMTACEATIDPRFGRMVIFDVQSGSHHGHPEPLRCPPNVTRRSIALYYYTSADNPSTPRLDYLGAQLRARPGERLQPPSPTGWRAWMVDLCPPLVARAIKRIRGQIVPSRW